MEYHWRVVVVGEGCGGHNCSTHTCTHTQSFENKQSLKATQQGGFTFPGVRTHFHLRRRQRDTECDGRQIEDVNEVEKRSHE